MQCYLFLNLGFQFQDQRTACPNQNTCAPFGRNRLLTALDKTGEGRQNLGSGKYPARLLNGALESMLNSNHHRHTEAFCNCIPGWRSVRCVACSGTGTLWFHIAVIPSVNIGSAVIILGIAWIISVIGILLEVKQLCVSRQLSQSKSWPLPPPSKLFFSIS